MSEAAEIFRQLLFGEGAWLGLILILSLVFLVGMKNKYLNLLFIPVLGFLGIHYLANVPVSVNFMWSGILAFIGCFLLGVQFTKHK